VEQPIAQVVSGILKADVYPRLREHEGGDSQKPLDELHLPRPVRRFLRRFPELTDPRTAPKDLKGGIEKHLGATEGGVSS
jgi:hypothetical protein